MDFTEEQKTQIEKEKQEAIEKALAEKEAELKKKHNEEMSNLRVSAKAEKEKAVKDAIENAKLTEEERVKKELEEQNKADREELAQLRLEKKINERGKKLVEAGVPELFKNDSRLINAEDDKVDEIIKTIKDEWVKVAPQGATVSTNVNNGGNGGKQTDTFAKFRNEGIRK